MNDTKHPGGRPTKYKPEFVQVVESLAKFGATMTDVAEAFGVAESTVYLWANEHPKFSEALRSGRAIRDEMVVNSLYHRAIGYTHKDVDIRVVQGELVETPIVKHYPPDTGAAEFILTNRRAPEWKRVQQIDSTSSDGSMSPQATNVNLDPETIRKIAEELDSEC